MKSFKQKNITRNMLLNCYGEDTMVLCQATSREAAFRWLKQANSLFVKVLGINTILENEAELRQIGW